MRPKTIRRKRREGMSVKTLSCWRQTALFRERQRGRGALKRGGEFVQAGAPDGVPVEGFEAFHVADAGQLLA